MDFLDLLFRVFSGFALLYIVLRLFGLRFVRLPARGGFAVLFLGQRIF